MYVGLTGSVLATWLEVSDIELRRGRSAYLVASVRDGQGRRERSLYGGFSAKKSNICALMTSRRNAAVPEPGSWVAPRG
jgi:hypothetical protein